MAAGFVLDDVVTVLGADGEADAERAPALTRAQVVALYRQMVLLRAVDEKAEALRQQGRVGGGARVLGEEALVVGALAALDERDWLFPDAATAVSVVLRGMPLRRWFDHLHGNGADPTKGRQEPGLVTGRPWRVAPVAGRAGMQLTESVGFAWASQVKGEGEVTLAFLDEATTGAGDFHNGLNFAGVYRAPVVFVCRSREGAPPAAKGAARTVAQKAFAYGVRPARADGEDLLAMVKVTREAAERARKGEGPTFIEAIVATGETGWDAGLESALRARGARDPIARVRRYLEETTAQREDDERGWKAELRAAIDQAAEQAEGAQGPALRTLFEDVFQTPPWHLREQMKSE